MKIVLLFLSMILGICSYSQTYHFDTGSTQEFWGEGKVISRTYKLTNSLNENYSLLIYGNDYASIFDRKTLIRHEFEVKSNETNKIELNYLRSCDEKDLFNRLMINKDKWHFKVRKINDSIFEFNEYKRAKSKKPQYRVVVKIKESSENHLNVLHPIDDRLERLLLDKLEKNKNYTIWEMSFFINEKKGKDSKLIDVTKYSDFQIQLPKKLILNESCHTHYFH